MAVLHPLFIINHSSVKLSKVGATKRQPHLLSDKTEYHKLSSEGVEVLEVLGKPAIRVSPEALRTLSAQAFVDVAHLLRPAHLQQLSNILNDPEASVDQFFYLSNIQVQRQICSSRVAQERQHCLWKDFTWLSRYRNSYHHGKERSIRLH